MALRVHCDRQGCTASKSHDQQRSIWITVDTHYGERHYCSGLCVVLDGISKASAEQCDAIDAAMVAQREALAKNLEWFRDMEARQAQRARPTAQMEEEPA